MAAILRDSTVVVVVAAAAVVRTRPRVIPLAMITMRKSTHGFPFVSHIWVAYRASLGGPSGRRSSAIIWRMTAILRDSIVAVVVVVRTRPRAIPLAKITMRKSNHGFPLGFYMGMGLPLAALRAAGAPLKELECTRESCFLVFDNQHFFTKCKGLSQCLLIPCFV